MQGQLFAPASPWRMVRDGHPVAKRLYERHYSARKNRRSKLICGPGYKVVLLTHDDQALFVWRKFISDDGQQGVNCAVFRNEGPLLSSALLLEAEQIVWSRWPGARLYTYVNPAGIRATNTNPGCCFKKAGRAVCGNSRAGLIILEKHPQ